MILIDGDHDLLGDGSVELLLTPGHTPGHQSVRVGETVIGGDVVHFSSVLDDHRFPIFGDDLEEQGRSADRLRTMRAMRWYARARGASWPGRNRQGRRVDLAPAPAGHRSVRHRLCCGLECSASGPHST